MIAEGRENGPIRLLMLEDRGWTMSPEQIEQLEDKISAYYNFIDSGQLPRVVANSSGRKCIVELVCQHDPPPGLVKMFPQIAELFARLSVEFKVALVRSLDGESVEMPVFP